MRKIKTWIREKANHLNEGVDEAERREKRENSDEPERVASEFEVDRLRIENRSHQIAFHCLESFTKRIRHRLKRKF